jgi:hypothetical protein
MRYCITFVSVLQKLKEVHANLFRGEYCSNQNSVPSNNVELINAVYVMSD